MKPREIEHAILLGFFMRIDLQERQSNSMGNELKTRCIFRFVWRYL